LEAGGGRLVASRKTAKKKKKKLAGQSRGSSERIAIEHGWGKRKGEGAKDGKRKSSEEGGRGPSTMAPQRKKEGRASS